MHHREQLKSNHQAQQKGNKKEISKTNQENESLLTVQVKGPIKKHLLRRKKSLEIAY